MFMEQGCVATRILRSACAYAHIRWPLVIPREVLTIAALVAPSDENFAAVTWSNRHRPHRALSLAPPEARRPSVASPPASGDARIVRRDRLGGVVHEHVPAA
jgi:hypothetical protein